MAEPIYGLWLARTKEAFFQLSKEEQEAIMAKRDENLAEVGGKDIAGYLAYSSQWEMFGVVEYPSTDAQKEHEMFCDSIDFKRYFDVMVVCGVPFSEE